MIDYELAENGTIVERHVPWWNLGTNVVGASSSQEALNIAGLDWKVESKNLYVDNLLVPNYKANVKSDDGKVLGIVSPKYQIVQNREAFDFTNNLVDEDAQFINAGSARSGKLVWLLLQLPTENILGDDVETYICFTNTHDGTGSIRVAMTPIRVACSNALNIAFKEASRTWSTKHMGNLSEKLFEAKRSLELAEEYMDNLKVKAEQFANNSVSDIEVLQIISKLFPITSDMSDRQKENTQIRRKEFLRCYAADDISKFKNTEWGVLNAAADFASHGVSLRNTSTAKERTWLSVINGSNVLDLTSKFLPSNLKTA